MPDPNVPASKSVATGSVSVPEIIALFPKLMGLFSAVKAAIASLPPTTNRKVVDWAVAFGFTVGSVGYLLADLIDTILADLAS